MAAARKETRKVLHRRKRISAEQAERRHPMRRSRKETRKVLHREGDIGYSEQDDKSVNRRIDESIKERKATITIRMPCLLIDKLDKAVQDGIFKSRSDGCRTALALHLATSHPDIEEAVKRVKEYLKHPIPGSRYAVALGGLLESAVDILIEGVPEAIDYDMLLDSAGNIVIEAAPEPVNYEVEVK